MRLATLIIFLLAPFAAAQSTQPSTQASTQPFESKEDLDATEAYATMAFNDKDYDNARWLLQLVADRLKSDPSQAKKVALLQEEIRVCEKNHVATASPEAAKAAHSSDVRTPHPAPKAGEVLEMNVRQLGNFDFDADKDAKIPDDVKALTGCTVRITGYMIPMDAADNIGKFALVPMPWIGGQGKIERTIVVTCPKGKAVTYCSDAITVEGKLTVEVQKEDGDITSIFQVEATSVKPVPK